MESKKLESWELWQSALFKKVQFFLPKSTSNPKTNINLIIKDDHNETIFSSNFFNENSNSRMEYQASKLFVNDTSCLLHQKDSRDHTVYNASVCKSVQTESTSTLPKSQSKETNERYQTDSPSRKSNKGKVSLKNPLKKITQTLKRKSNKV